MSNEKKSILIVDDKISTMSSLLNMLTTEGFNVIQATNGEEGLKNAFQFHPDIILLDIVMPIMDGLTMLKILRRDTWGRNVPVVVLTNLDNDNSAVAALDSLAYDYLIKNQTKDEEIMQIIKNKINQQ
ncbi:MAG: response regulator [Patescibacteria group bacterium]|nr:response regulator [Patescibacteria group bacterium]